VVSVARAHSGPPVVSKTSVAVCAMLTAALFMGIGVPAGAVPPPPPNPSDQQIQDSQSQASASAAEIGRLSGLVTTTEGDIHRLNDDLELKGELVKKALIDQQLAESDAVTAERAAASAAKDSVTAGGAINGARAKAAAFAAASYRQGSVLGSVTALMDASSASDLLDRHELLAQVSKSQLDVIAKLQTSLSNKANVDSDARVARDQATVARAAAVKAAHDAAAAQQSASDAFVAGKTQLAGLHTRLDQQENDYQLALSKVAGLKDQRAQYNDWLAAKKAEEERLRLEAIARAKAAAAAKLAAEQAAARAAAEHAAALARAQAAERARIQAVADAAAKAAQAKAVADKAAAEQAARVAKKRFDDEQRSLRAQADANRAAARAAAAQSAARAADAARAANAAQAASEASAARKAAAALAAAVRAADATKNQPGPAASVYFATCADAVNAGVAPIHRGQPGFRDALDTNGNGIACEILRNDTGGGAPAPAASPPAVDVPVADAPAANPPPAQPSQPSSGSGGWTAEKGQAAVAAAEQWVGTPYSWGGGTSSGPTTGICGPNGAENDCNVVGFDCSGLTSYGWAQQGISIPNLSAYQYTLGQHVATSDLMPGDLLFYANDTSDPSTIHHVAMYAGNGEMVEAPFSGSFVHVTSADFGNGYIGATRVGT